MTVLKDHSSGNADAGFTLTEMLVVLMIIGLMSSLVVPSFGTLAKPSSQSIASEVLNVAQLTRLSALRLGKRQALTIDAESGIIRSEAGGQQVDVPKLITFSATFGRTGKDTAQKGSITFFPDGGATGGEIRFAGRSGPTVLVSVNWLTGVATLSEVSDGAR